MECLTVRIPHTFSTGMWISCGMWNVECGMWNVECGMSGVMPCVLRGDLRDMTTNPEDLPNNPELIRSIRPIRCHIPCGYPGPTCAAAPRPHPQPGRSSSGPRWAGPAAPGLREPAQPHRGRAAGVEHADRLVPGGDAGRADVLQPVVVGGVRHQPPVVQVAVVVLPGLPEPWDGIRPGLIWVPGPSGKRRGKVEPPVARPR